MRDRLLLLGYGVAVLAITSIHEPLWLAAALALLLLASGREAFTLARRAALAILLFNSVVTLSYVLLTTLRGEPTGDYVLLLNLRVFLLTYLGFLVASRVNLFRGFGFSPTLSYLLTLAYSQALGLRRIAEEFRLALRSRTLGRLAMGDLYRHRASLATHLLEKARHDTAELGQAMRSRGFFGD